MYQFGSLCGTVLYGCTAVGLPFLLVMNVCFVSVRALWILLLWPFFVKVFSVAAYMLNSPACMSRSRIALYGVGAIGEANKCGQPTL